MGHVILNVYNPLIRSFDHGSCRDYTSEMTLGSLALNRAAVGTAHRAHYYPVGLVQ